MKMFNTLSNYFENVKKIQLDKKSKGVLYINIQKNISHSFGLKNSITYRSKIISIVLIVALFFSGIQYTIFNSDSNSLYGNVAQADFIGTVISWNGSYQILDSKQLILNTENTQIPLGGSLILEKGSQVKVKTKNNTTADIIGPAKITFAKENNKLIVDVKYSQHIDIKKPLLVTTVEQKPELLVIKSEQKIIIASNEVIDLSLDTKDNNTTVKNNIGEIAVTQLDSNKTVSLQANDSLLLDAEVTLFAREDNKGVNKEVLKKDKQNQEEDVFVQITTEGISGVLDVLENPSSNVVSKSGTIIGDEMKFSNTEARSSNQIMDTINNDDLDITKDTSDIALKVESPTQIKTNDAKTDIVLNNLLDNKEILPNRLIILLNDTYKLYIHNQKDISKISDNIMILCKELSIHCDTKNIIHSLSLVNTKIVDTYIITPEINLIK